MSADDDFEEETRLIRADVAAIGVIRAGGTMAEAVRAAIKAYMRDLVPDAATGGFPLTVVDVPEGGVWVGGQRMTVAPGAVVKLNGEDVGRVVSLSARAGEEVQFDMEITDPAVMDLLRRGVMPSDLHDPEALNLEDTLASIEDLPDPDEPRYPFDG